MSRVKILPSNFRLQLFRTLCFYGRVLVSRPLFLHFEMKMFTLTVFIFAFLGFFQSSLCQNGYNYPQNIVRQSDANGNPIMPGTAQGQPIGGQIGGQQQPAMPGTGAMPPMGGNQVTPQNTMPNQQFPPQNTMPNQQFPPQNAGGTVGTPTQQPQLPQNQFSGPNQQFPQNQFAGQGPQYPQNQFVPNRYPQGQVPGMNPQYTNQHPGVHYPEPPLDMHLSPDGIYAYGYLMHMIEQMLNNPTARNNLLYMFNNLEMVMANPRSTPIIQEFFNRWTRALTDTPVAQTGTFPTNVVVQNPASSFFDTLRRKGNALVNLAKDVTMAKTKALNSLFDDSLFSPAVQVGTNWMNAGMQGVQGTVSPLIGTTPGTTGQILTTGTPVITTTPQVTVQG